MRGQRPSADYAWKISLSREALGGCLSFLSAPFSICLTRSLVIEISAPTCQTRTRLVGSITSTAASPNGHLSGCCPVCVCA